MSEAKQRLRAALLKGMTDAAADEGKIIELGWLALRAAAIPKDAPAVQIDEMRNAFFAGAQHLFSSIMEMLDPDHEPTERDMLRMDNIDKELRAFIEDYAMRNIPTRGEA